MQAGRRIAPLRCSKHPSPPGGTGRSGSPGGSPAPRRQAGNSRHAPPTGREPASPHFSKQHVPDAPGRNASRFCTPPRPPFSRVCLRPQEKNLPPPAGRSRGKLPAAANIFPAQSASESIFSPSPRSCAHTTPPHALRDNNMRRRAPLAFSPSASFSGHAPLPRALFFHRARRRTRPFFIYKHPG